jgi:hypothetical protein
VNGAFVCDEITRQKFGVLRRKRYGMMRGNNKLTEQMDNERSGGFRFLEILNRRRDA